MPAIEEDIVPKAIKPYLFHGLDIEHGDHLDQAIGICPFCDKKGMYINQENGCWDCKKCGKGAKGSGEGNLAGFLKLFHAELNGHGIDEFAAERGFLSTETMQDWGVGFSHFNQRWYVPGYNPDGNLCQLYRYTKMGDKMRLLATPTMNHQIHGMSMWDDKKSIIYICEGPFDGIALCEILGKTKLLDSGYTLTSNYAKSLLKDSNVIAFPGANVINESWCKLFKGKHVVLMYDNDHPKKNKQGKDIAPAGISGMKRAAAVLTETTDAPLSISYLCWGEDGYDLTLPSGFDVRDMLNKGKDTKTRVKQLSILLDKVKPVPHDWLTPTSKAKKSKSGSTLELKECTDHKTLIASWRRAMKWTSGLEAGLNTMLASIISTNCVGDQLWVKIIGPPSCGKSTLCEALSINTDHILAKSTIRGFHSGFQSEDKEEDVSLIAQVNGKTLVTKDGDTLIQSPNLGQVLSEARDVYDRNSRTHYRNSQSREYLGINMTWILCGTNSLRSLDNSELGERFLDCVIMENIDAELERDILWRVANSADRNLLIESDGDPQNQQSPEMTEAMQLTGGYVTYLKENAMSLLGEVKLSDEVKRFCMDLGMFVAYMRARPSSKQDETSEREFAARLVSQHVRATRCLGAIMNIQDIQLGDPVMNLVTKLGLDTARGKTLAIIEALAKFPKRGMESTAVANAVSKTTVETRNLLRFLTRIGALESVVGRSKGMSSGVRWRLSESLLPVFNSVYGVSNGTES